MSESELSIRTMDRDNLLRFFYSYIQKSQYISERSDLITYKTKLNNSKFNSDIETLDSRYNKFYEQNLKANQIEAKEKIEWSRKKVKAFEKKWSNMFLIFTSYSGRIKYRYLFILVWILRYIFITKHPFQGGGFFTVVFTALGMRLFAGPFSSFIHRRLEKHYERSMKQARKKDHYLARQKGITQENAKEVFGYQDIKDKINNYYYDLGAKIKTWEDCENKEITRELNILKQDVPVENRAIESIIYMYEQLYVGATDTWKEAINDLKLHLRHQEVTNELRNLTKQISRTNNQLVQMSSDLNRNFAQLDNMISHETNRINSRIDGLYENVEGLYYY